MTCAVAIAWVNPFELLEPVLRVLAEKSSVRPDEIIVATRLGAEEQARLRSAFPAVHLIMVARDAAIPDLRAMAIRASTSAVVLVTEDHCIPASDWIERATAAIANGAAIIGGPVENAWKGGLRDEAAFLTEYSGVIRPARAAVVNVIPGNNVAYAREAAFEIARTFEAGLWESFAFEAMRKRGVRFRFDRDMLVYHRRPFGFRYFLGQRLHFCRSFAAMRCRNVGTGGRLKYAIGSLALPLLLPVRTTRNLIERGRLTGRFLLCLPLIALYFAAGAAGEFTGYLFGGSTSLTRVE